jgi:hypothetical protein
MSTTRKTSKKTSKKISAPRVMRMRPVDDPLDREVPHGALPRLEARFSGAGTLITGHSRARGPFREAFSVELLFSEGNHRDASISSFEPIEVSFDTPLGRNTTTITMERADGTFDRRTRHMQASMQLVFDHSLPLARTSGLGIMLRSVEPITASGRVTLRGSSTFTGGQLDGHTGTLTLEGQISPSPGRATRLRTARP